MTLAFSSVRPALINEVSSGAYGKTVFLTAAGGYLDPNGRTAPLTFTASTAGILWVMCASSPTFKQKNCGNSDNMND
jgi:hypothetical protein